MITTTHKDSIRVVQYNTTVTVTTSNGVSVKVNFFDKMIARKIVRVIDNTANTSVEVINNFKYAINKFDGIIVAS